MSAVIKKHSQLGGNLIVTSNTVQVYLPAVIELGIRLARANNLSFTRKDSIIDTYVLEGGYPGNLSYPGTYYYLNELYYQIAVIASNTSPYSPLIVNSGTILQNMGKELHFMLDGETIIKMCLVKRVRIPGDVTDTSNDVYYITTYFKPGVDFTYGGAYGGSGSGPYSFDPVAVAAGIF